MIKEISGVEFLVIGNHVINLNEITHIEFNSQKELEIQTSLTDNIMIYDAEDILTLKELFFGGNHD